MLVVRHVARMGAQLVRYGVRSGRWWMPLMVPVLAAAAVAVVAAKTVVPTVVYVFF
jgi:hypothetical protein